jgi:hypothetical protein
LNGELLKEHDFLEQAYASGVPMGGVLSASGKDPREPRFLLWALQDSNSVPLQRLRVVKAWLEEGVPRENVIDVAWSDNLVPDPESGRCPDNGATVNLQGCSTSADRCATELKTFWSDPDFDASQSAVYYVRALENPSCRWSTFDSLSLG